MERDLLKTKNSRMLKMMERKSMEKLMKTDEYCYFGFISLIPLLDKAFRHL